MSSLADDELAELRARIIKLRATIHSDKMMEVVEILEGMVRWLVDLDDEVNELESRMNYFDHEHE